MKIYTEDNINYDEYLQQQVHRATKKWGRNEGIKVKFSANFHGMWKAVNELIGNPQTIGCMGIRSGAEYLEFKKYLPKADVYGVDIGPDVVKVGKNCFCYDFNHLPEDWKEKFDLLYSNSIDHSFDVKATITEWSRVTKPNGFIIMVFSTTEDLGGTDRYSFTMEDIDELFTPDKFEKIKAWPAVEQEVIYTLFKKRGLPNP